MTVADTVSDNPLLLHCTPGICAPGVHIALEWAGVRYENNRVSRKNLKSEVHLARNPSAVVPTLSVAGKPLTGVSAITLWFAWRISDLGPNRGDNARFDFEHTVVLLGGTLHPYIWPWLTLQHYGATSTGDQAKVKGAAEQLIKKALSTLVAQHDGRTWLCGDTKTVADADLLPMARWGYEPKHHPTSQFPYLDRHMNNLAALPDVQAAMAPEGLKPMTFSTPSP